MRSAGRALVLHLALLLAGCLNLGRLTGPAATLHVRTFTPEVPQGAPGLVDPPERETGTPTLKLLPVQSGAALRKRILHRVSPTEVDAYEDKRWTENPEEYLRRSLAHALFSEHPVVETVSGESPTLAVELVAFEELGTGTCRRGRVQLLYRLEEHGAVRTSGVVTIERPAKKDDIEDVVLAIGQAMDAASARLASVVAETLVPGAGGAPAAPEPEEPRGVGACVASSGR